MDFYKKNPTQFDQYQFGKDKALQRGDVYIVEAEEVWTDMVPFPLGDFEVIQAVCS